MLKELEIHNFKCFQGSPSFKFSKINLLTGINGRGKSSLLQSLLILCQSARRRPLFNQLIINDELLSLGNYDDIKNSETPRGEKIIFKWKTTNDFFREVVFEYDEEEKDALLAKLVSVIIKSKEEEIVLDERGITALTEPSESVAFKLIHMLRRMHYVSADRMGPVKYVEKTNLPDFRHVGVRGEHTIKILSNYGDYKVNRNLYLGDNANTLLQQTEEWLNYILDGAILKLEGQSKESSVLSMLLNSKKNSYRYKPSNVGFGYSYILPLIVTGLIAGPDDIVIIENPEAHLHPRAQSRITEFFAKVASCGVQVFIESHSEHILNSLRISALEPKIGLNNKDLSILYFNEDFMPTSLVVDEKGKIAEWPEGFFDQQEIDLSSIFKLGR